MKPPFLKGAFLVESGKCRGGYHLPVKYLLRGGGGPSKMVEEG